MDPLSSFQPLVPSRPTTQPKRDHDVDDRFASLFSPPSPSGSRAPTPIFTQPQPRPPMQSLSHARTPSSATSDFGFFVSVPASEDPLFSASTSEPGPTPFTPLQDANYGFFEQFANGARAATEKSRQGVLDELAHEDDPLFFFRTEVDTSKTTSSVNSSSPRPSSKAELVAEFDPLAPPQHQPPEQDPDAPLTSGAAAISSSPSPPTEFHSDSSAEPPAPRPRSTSPRLTRSHSTSSRWIPSVLATRGSPADVTVAHDGAVAAATGTGGVLGAFGSFSRSVAGSLRAAPIPRAPFGTHTYVPSTGAPGFAGERAGLAKIADDKAKDAHTDDSEPPSQSVVLMGRKESTTYVLDVELADAIRSRLPALSRLSHSWTMLYSLDQHGISIHTLYARCAVQPRGALMVVKDSDGARFGVWAGDGIRLSPGAYYGSGESFMWRSHPEEGLKVYRWTGKNDYIALCEPSFISFGGGDGHYGLFLDDTLFDGSSAPCPTFDNEPLCTDGPRHGGSITFECVGLEVWGVG